MQAARLIAVIFASLSIAAASPARSATFAASELSYDSALLSQFNLINIGNLNVTATTSIGGRALVGGNFTGTGTETVCAGGTSSSCSGNTTLGVSSTTSTGVVNATSTSSNSTSSAAPNYGYGALTVFGNVTGAVNITNGGDLNIGGNISGNTYQLNSKSGVNVGGASVAGTTINGATEVRATSAAGSGTISNAATGFTYEGADTIAQVFAPFAQTSAVANNFQAPLRALYSGIANLPGSPGVTSQALPTLQIGTFTSAADYTSGGKTYGVVTTTMANLAAETALFTGVANGAGNAATFVIVTGDGANYTLPTLTNNDSKVIYDFVGATTLKVGGNFNASILAPLANLTTTGTGTINGTVVVASMTQSQALMNGNAFTGDLSGLTGFGYNARVPEPASLLMFGVGLAALAGVRWRAK